MPPASQDLREGRTAVEPLNPDFASLFVHVLPSWIRDDPW